MKINWEIARQSLLHLIEHKGSCNSLQCIDCIFSVKTLGYGDGSCTVRAYNSKFIYEIAVNEYIERWDRDADLLGVLI